MADIGLRQLIKFHRTKRSDWESKYKNQLKSDLVSELRIGDDGQLIFIVEDGANVACETPSSKGNRNPFLDNVNFTIDWE
jgi:hypothetical protein